MPGYASATASQRTRAATTLIFKVMATLDEEYLKKGWSHTATCVMLNGPKAGAERCEW